MSDSEEENYCFFGKPLEPYDEDAFPKKKPISVEDQIATDAQGRRRFHGAFTGGFSAGFYNTVGSLEGWLPGEFKSTRQEKAENFTQKPEDFMDDEDTGQFGIAPQTVRATSDYSTSKKRKKQVFSDGPIPGEPVLHSLLTSGNETIGYLLLKNIGLKDKKTLEDDEGEEEQNERVYGCEMPKTYEISRNDDVPQYVIPEIYKEFLKNPKDNTFGLGYVGLDKSHVNLFQSSKLVIKERNKKKVSISGQAFGVGAFEDDDEDIYVKEDMSKYDFELTSEKSSQKDNLSIKEKTIFDDFIASKNILPPREIFAAPTIPHSFTGKHKIKKSRFEPLPEPETPERKDMNPEIRARYLGEETTTSNSNASTNIPTSTNQSEEIEDSPVPIPNIKEESENKEKNSEIFSISSSSGLVFDRFVSASKPEDPSNILEAVEKTGITHGTQEMRDAARMKMFGPLTRIITDWQPCSLLCKRFNVPEPHFDELKTSKNQKRTKNLIFEYEKYADTSGVAFKPGLLSKEDENQKETIETDGTVTQASEEPMVVQPEDIKQEEPEISQQKTDETPKDITEKIDVNKNIDLFKAVFLSSSESEDEEEKEKQETQRTTEIKSSVLSDALLPSLKPIKEGILSNVDFSVFTAENEEQIEQKANNQTTDNSNNSVQEAHDLSYGPVLPTKPQTFPTNTISTKTQLKYKDDSDEWVEKSSDSKNKSHKKKHKHKKSSHKKKHKHKDR